ncbi:isochorismatase [Roseofilum reptotaenium CS-1145]|uniref:Isochorismatase n=1 Tax=Roseofilum reptotaenium AO1-A TaxID=1925591 RepID=A0A1L9QR42_9CYAN|nr:isochorismatase [Roseofilum reptotaenium CS-1145]OJJ25160.1 isochorismatase [Roseofilum reptotaenium AO1-A]
MSVVEYPIPTFFDPDKVSEVWRVPYQERADRARYWAQEQGILPASDDRLRVCLLAIDVQNTFCLPEFELFVGGASGKGAVEDNQRLCEFIYRNLGTLTAIAPTLDTHTAMQIFHPLFWIDETGEHPTPAVTNITLEAVQEGHWKANPAVAQSIMGGDREALQAYALHYVQTLSDEGKYPLTVWPYHSMLGGIGHALVSSVEEAIFFHNLVRHSQTLFDLKGNHPLTENYSVLRAEVLTGVNGEEIASKNESFLNTLFSFDRLIIAGQAKSHCVAWTVSDLLTEILARDPQWAQKVYLLEDCTSPVVVPGAVDFTEQANATFARFAAAGMHRVESTQPVESWPQW